MLKLIKNMRRKEKEMALLCLVFVVVQIYFDLRLPDYMTELTMLIKTSGTTADIAAVGLKMLGCTAASAVLAIACGFLAAKTASGFSFRAAVISSPAARVIKSAASAAAPVRRVFGDFFKSAFPRFPLFYSAALSFTRRNFSRSRWRTMATPAIRPQPMPTLRSPVTV